MLGRKRQGTINAEVSQGAWPCQYLDFWLGSPQPWETYISAVLSYPTHTLFHVLGSEYTTQISAQSKDGACQCCTHFFSEHARVKERKRWWLFKYFFFQTAVSHEWKNWQLVINMPGPQGNFNSFIYAPETLLFTDISPPSLPTVILLLPKRLKLGPGSTGTWGLTIACRWGRLPAMLSSGHKAAAWHNWYPWCAIVLWARA